MCKQSTLGVHISSSGEDLVVSFGKKFSYDLDREFREHVKDLSCLSKDLCRTVIVDNNPFSFLLQPLNGIPCIPFSAGQPHDTQVAEFALAKSRSISIYIACLFTYHFLHLVLCWKASGCPSSTSQAPFSAERCEISSLWQVSYAWMVPKAGYPCFLLVSLGKKHTDKVIGSSGYFLGQSLFSKGSI